MVDSLLPFQWEEGRGGAEPGPEAASTSRQQPSVVLARRLQPRRRSLRCISDRSVGSSVLLFRPHMPEHQIRLTGQNLLFAYSLNIHSVHRFMSALLMSESSRMCCTWPCRHAWFRFMTTGQRCRWITKCSVFGV